jgi:hypothetical protein
MISGADERAVDSVLKTRLWLVKATAEATAQTSDHLNEGLDS